MRAMPRPGERIEVLLGQGTDARRDGSGVYGQAVHRVLPTAVHVGDRAHLVKLCEAVLKEVQT